MLKSNPIESAEEVLRRYLAENQMRFTPERFAVLDAALRRKRPFSASDIWDDMSVSGYRVSRASVFQTIGLLCRCGVLAEVALGGNESRYAARREGYLYLVCTGCGRIREERDPTVALHFRGRRFEAFTPAYHSTAVFGTCSTCMRRQRREAKTSKEVNQGIRKPSEKGRSGGRSPKEDIE